MKMHCILYLEHFLHATSHIVVLRAHNVRVENTRRRVERVDGRVDTQLGDRTREHSGGVQVRESRSRRRVRQVVRGHVDGLYRSDRALASRRDALLHRAHVSGERRLVADRRRDTAEQSRHFRTSLSEAANTVVLHVCTIMAIGEQRLVNARFICNEILIKRALVYIHV